MPRPTDLPDHLVAYGPAPVAKKARNIDRAAINSLTAHRFDGIPPELANRANDHSGCSSSDGE
jgi:hypothetical protein